MASLLLLWYQWRFNMAEILSIHEFYSKSVRLPHFLFLKTLSYKKMNKFKKLSGFKKYLLLITYSSPQNFFKLAQIFHFVVGKRFVK